MTDKLRAAAEMMFESLANAHESLIDVENALRQALAEWTPDDTAYRPDGLSQDELPPEMGIDRGAWSDVENATQWVDELRGDEPVADVNTSEERVSISDKQGHECQELKASGPIGEIIEAHGLIAVSIPEMPPVGTKLYTEEQVRQMVEGETRNAKPNQDMCGND